MNLLSGLEKFGLGQSGILDITADEKKKSADSEQKSAANVVEPEEKDFVLEKKFKCPVCDKEFLAKTVTTTKLKRIEPDFDLRPNYMYIDSIKYDFLHCYKCGYTALASTFLKIDSARMKLVREGICKNFTPVREEVGDIYTYDYAIEKFKLALVNTMVKRGKLSEKAYVCLKIAWLRRSQLAILEKEKAEEAKLAEVKQEYEGFYRQAYEGFMKALETETPPYCGMDSSVVEYMLANMADSFEEYDTALKLIGRLMGSPATNSRLKDKCLTLKEQINQKKK